MSIISLAWDAYSPLTPRRYVISCSTGPTLPDITVISDDEDDLSHDQETVVSITTQQSFNIPVTRCPGYKLPFPPSQQAHTSYPFGLHTLLSLPWDYSARREGFFLTSHSCAGETEGNGPCRTCAGLGQNKYVQSIITRYTDGIHENAPLVYHGIGGLIDVVHRKSSAIDRLRLRRLNDMRKLAGKEGVIEVHKQMLLALSTQCIPRIDRVLRVGFKNGAGIHTMLDLIKKAGEGTYHPKGFEEEEELQALLFLRLGGARVAGIAHHVFGTPSVSTIRSRTTVPQILPSPSFPTHYEVLKNISSTFDGILDLMRVSQNLVHGILMFDELATEKRPRWDDKSNKFLGVCREHGHMTSLEFTSEDDLVMLWNELESGKIHLSHEVRDHVSHA